MGVYFSAFLQKTYQDFIARLINNYESPLQRMSFAILMMHGLKEQNFVIGVRKTIQYSKHIIFYAVSTSIFLPWGNQHYTAMRMERKIQHIQNQ